MRILILVSLLAICWAENPKDDVQLMNIKSVKGGGGSYQYTGGQNYNRFYNNSTQYGYAQLNHTTVNHEVGVCYIEVPTATLVRDPKHIPAGNGSRPDLSRIRTCCAGYIRNIHNFHICDPVCTTECVNALCTAPDTCTCFPEHVKNLAGFCVATCPIGCQNGHCNGGECLCKEGFKLEVRGRFCVPYCRDNCGGMGNCTAPNTCACRPGYASTPGGSCKPGTPGSYQQNVLGSYPQPGATGYPQPGSQQCGACLNGYCMGTECRCRPGYLIYKGECIPLCTPNCGPNTECVSPNVCAPKPGPGVNATQPHNSSYPSYPQYQYPHSTQNTTYQNPNQYPYGQHSQNQNQYPYPNNQNPQYPGNTQNNTYSHNSNPTNPDTRPEPIYRPYPGQHNQYPGQSDPGQQNQYPGQSYPGQQNQYPGQTYPGQQNQYPDRYPYHNQPNATNQYPQPGHQHLYPDLPSNNYPNNPQTNHGRPNGTDGQVYYQNRPYNPLENATYNLQQGGSDHTQGQNGTQGQHYGGQYSHGQNGQGQYSHGQNSQGQYDQGRFDQGQYNQGQYGQGQYGQGQYGQGQYGQGQYGQGQYDQGQYGQGHYNQGQYGQGQYSQGNYGHGQYNQSQYGQGDVQGQYGQNPYGQSVVYDQSNTGGRPGSQVSGSGVSQCEQPCVNGNCVGPNTCECFPGYDRNQADPTGTRCVPHCAGGCVNGYCAAPNSCSCNEGYYKDFSVKGRQACVRRNKRSAEETVDVADLLVFDIPDY